MIKVSVFKASPTMTDVPSVLIDISDTIPMYEDLQVSRMLFDSDARRLFDVLKASLPGGTLDALLRLLLENRASRLRVPG